MGTSSNHPVQVRALRPNGAMDMSKVPQEPSGDQGRRIQAPFQPGLQLFPAATGVLQPKEPGCE
jgi:hypothetical protein